MDCVTLIGVPIIMSQTVAECLAGIVRTILLPVVMVLTAIVVTVAPGSDAAHGAIQNAFTVGTVWIVAEGAGIVSAVALRWLDAERNAI